MVTWGPNQVREFGNSVGGTTASPAAPAAPSTGFNFGGTPAAAAPAPAGAFSFAGAAAPTAAPATSVFGAPTSAFGTPSFGATTPAAAPAATSAFGSFGSTATASTGAAPFGSNASATSTPGLGAPQQAALQAHMNATFQQQSTRLEQELMHLLSSYQPLPPQNALPTNTTPSTCRFLHIFYNPMTCAQKLESQSLLPYYPPKPTNIPHLTEDIWQQALSSNPNPAEYIPIVISSAEGLHHRRVYQLTQVQSLEQITTQLESVLQTRHSHWEQYATLLKSMQQRHVQLKQRVLHLLAQVELCRGKGVVLQPAERTVLTTISKWLSALKTLEENLGKLHSQGQVYKAMGEELAMQRHGLDTVKHNDGHGGLREGFSTNAKGLLAQQGVGLESLKTMVKGDARDLKLIQEGLANL